MGRKPWTKVWGADLLSSQRYRALSSAGQRVYLHLLLLADEEGRVGIDGPDGTVTGMSITTLAREVLVSDHRTLRRALEALRTRDLVRLVWRGSDEVVVHLPRYVAKTRGPIQAKQTVERLWKNGTHGKSPGKSPGKFPGNFPSDV